MGPGAGWRGLTLRRPYSGVCGGAPEPTPDALGATGESYADMVPCSPQ